MNKNTKRAKTINRKFIRTGEQKVISENTNNNKQMIVLKNSGGGSITRHEPINKLKPFLKRGKVSSNKETLGTQKQWHYPGEEQSAQIGNVSYGEEK
jgi:hypothetical protein